MVKEIIFKGKAWVFGDHINTDVIIPAKFLSQSSKSLGRYAMFGIDPNFREKISKGDIVVAGKNFGCGSSREQAPLSIKDAGISCVIARSFGRIFFRNAINIGLPIVICDWEDIEDGDKMEVNLTRNTARNCSKGTIFKSQKLPSYLQEVILAGGIIKFILLKNKEGPSELLFDGVKL